MTIEVLCTLGPASLRGPQIRRLTELGVSLFRINLSHTSLSSLPGVIATIREHTSVPICLDTEGAQIRTGRIVGSLTARDHALLRIHDQPVVGGGTDLGFYPPGALDGLRPGDLVSIDFTSVLVQVVDRQPGIVTVRVLNGGEIRQNKAVSVLGRDVALPPLTAKDVEALRLGAELGITHVALSFARSGSDVDAIRELAAPGTTVISKIECRAGMENLTEIAAHSDALLIDRGDLSREFPIERIPALQKAIIRHARSAGRKVYVATNLLESMVAAPTPTRAEVNDIYNTLLDGADGLVLAAETAIGRYPVGCASMVLRLIREFEADQQRTTTPLLQPVHSMLVEPHGGRLVQPAPPDLGPDPVAPQTTLVVDDSVLLDCEQIARGAYSPLTGFMDRETLRSVLDTSRLPGGLVWPMPVLLQVSAEQAAGLGPGERIGLLRRDGMLHSVLDVTEVAPLDFATVATGWFGTTSRDHPGVARLAARGSHLVAGAVTVVRPEDSASRAFELSPSQARAVFAGKGWSRVVAFHTRNIAFRVHEHIQLRALEQSGADGLFISAIIGPKRADGWSSDAIMRSYQLTIDLGVFPTGTALLGAFPTYARFSGPREWVFAALCEKNMGCSHFVVGPERRTASGATEPGARRRYFESLGDIGIVPLFVEPHAWHPRTRSFQPLDDRARGEARTGKHAREQLRRGGLVPEWLIRPEIQDMLRADLSAGRSIFAS